MYSLALLPLICAVASAGYVHPVVPAASTQYHSQDALGQYAYGYAEPNAAKHETKSADGVVAGSYSYVAPNGQLIKNDYVADANGFRSNLAPTADKDFSLPAVGYGRAFVAEPALVAPYAAPYAAPAVYSRAYAPAFAPAYGHYAAPGFAYRTDSIGYGAPAFVKSYGHGLIH